MPRQLIINADDLGFSRNTNLAVLRGHHEGPVGSASLLANMPAFEHAVECVVGASPRLGVGVHLCVTSGRPVLAPEEVPLLVDRQGRFAHGPAGIWRVLRRSEEARLQVQREWAAQVRRVETCGICPDHFDSHEHVHMLPQLFPIVVELAVRRGAAFRVADEPWGAWSPARVLSRFLHGGAAKKLVLAAAARKVRSAIPPAICPARYFGVLDGGRWTPAWLLETLGHLPQGVSELNVHVGLAGPLDAPCDASPRDAAFHRSARRAAELAALRDRKFLRGLLAGRIELTRFCQTLAASRQAV